MMLYRSYKEIDTLQWNELVQKSDTATWFQTPEAYALFASLPDEFKPFVYGVSENGQLSGIIVGYITQEKNRLKQFFTRRAIIIGGPLLDTEISSEALSALLQIVRSELSKQAIYIETRNFNDYSRWKDIFRAQGFSYQPHLNFHIHTANIEEMERNIGKNRKRDIKTTIRDGVVPVMQPTMEQVGEFYSILRNLYKTKVKTPCFPGISLSIYTKLLMVISFLRNIGGALLVVRSVSVWKTKRSMNGLYVEKMGCMSIYSLRRMPPIWESDMPQKTTILYLI